MGRLHIILNDNIEKEFRIKLAKKGYKKGDISKRIEDLIKGYLRKKKV